MSSVELTSFQGSRQMVAEGLPQTYFSPPTRMAKFVRCAITSNPNLWFDIGRWAKCRNH